MNSRTVACVACRACPTNLLSAVEGVLYLARQAILQRVQEPRQVLVRPCAHSAPEPRSKECLLQIKAIEESEPGQIRIAPAGQLPVLWICTCELPNPCSFMGQHRYGVSRKRMSDAYFVGTGFCAVPQCNGATSSTSQLQLTASAGAQAQHIASAHSCEHAAVPVASRHASVPWPPGSQSMPGHAAPLCSHCFGRSPVG